MQGILRQASLEVWDVQFVQEDTILLQEMLIALLAKLECIPQLEAVIAQIVLQAVSQRPGQVNAACVPKGSTTRLQAPVNVWKVHWVPLWQRRDPHPTHCVR